MAVISMTREMGSRGRDVAIGLAERLGLHILHHEVVRRLADRAQEHESAVRRYLEGSDNPLERWRLKRKKLDYYTAEEILDIAAAGDVIVRGWGATQILRPIAHVVSVRVCAPIERRIETLFGRTGMADRKVARAEIESNDAAHGRVTRRLHGVDWQDPLHYDLILNTGRVPIEECVEQIVRLVDLPAFQETPESRAALVALRAVSRTPARKPAAHVERRRATSRMPNFDWPVIREDRDLV